MLIFLFKFQLFKMVVFLFFLISTISIFYIKLEYANFSDKKKLEYANLENNLFFFMKT